MKAVLLVLSVLFATNCYTPNVAAKKVPELVTKAFKAKYPETRKVHWELNKMKQYEAEFKMQGVEYSSFFDETGKWIKTEQEIKNKELPDAVQASIKREFSDFKIKEALRGTAPDGMKYYAVEIRTGKKNYDLSVSPDGKVLMKISI